MIREIPCVPAAAVRPSDNNEVVYLVSLRGKIEDKMTVQEFRKCVGSGSAFRADLGPWPEGYVLLIDVGTILPIWVTVTEAEGRLKEFVSQQLEAGHQALPFSRDKALRHFDLARRVSNEPEDTIRVCYLLEGNDRSVWTEWLEENYPDIDHRAKALKLGLIAG